MVIEVFLTNEIFFFLFNTEPAPPNVLTINDEFDAAMVLKWLRMNHDTERKENYLRKKKEIFDLFF